MQYKIGQLVKYKYDDLIIIGKILTVMEAGFGFTLILEVVYNSDRINRKECSVYSAYLVLLTELEELLYR